MIKFNHLVIILALFTILPFSKSEAQTWGVQVGVDYDTPLKKLSEVYKPATTFNVSAIQMDDNSSLEFTLGFINFQPKAEQFYYSTDAGINDGIATFSNFKITSAYIGWQHYFRLHEYISLAAGFNFGAYFSKQESTYVDNRFNSTNNIENTNVYFAPKTGICFNLTPSLLLNLQARYNLFAPTGKRDDLMPMFNSDLGTVYQSWSTGISIAYLF